MAKRSYSKFYALLRKNPRIDKDEMVLQFTDGRTTHLTQMTDAEYEEMVATIETATNNTAEELRRWRSSALLRIGRLGINTIDNWAGINSFVSSSKIAGKRFYDLTVVELQELVRKLEMIINKGGLHGGSDQERKDVPMTVVHIRPSEVAS